MNIKRLYSKLIVLTAISLSLVSCANDDDNSEYNATFPKIESRNTTDTINSSNTNPAINLFGKEKEKERPQACQGWNCVQFD
ncbi:hypothetical protein [Faecalibacter bovis]|uniref:Lipoprotein n=1 Tax=Faecalibacter bovis TaxID=2898187 RepID=A0ABX7XAF3_9FLAO|nr:hypothetical protein [Faecalibacter bovis]QTV04870.1 hypothetical protein J9309_08670 [Faecalibacter bovis]